TAIRELLSGSRPRGALGPTPAMGHADRNHRHRRHRLKNPFLALSGLRQLGPRNQWPPATLLPESASVWAMVHKVPPWSGTRPGLEARILHDCRISGWTVTELSKSLGAPESSILAILGAYERPGNQRPGQVFPGGVSVDRQYPFDLPCGSGCRAGRIGIYGNCCGIGTA